MRKRKPQCSHVVSFLFLVASLSAWAVTQAFHPPTTSRGTSAAARTDKLTVLNLSEEKKAPTNTIVSLADNDEADDDEYNDDENDDDESEDDFPTVPPLVERIAN